MTFSDSSTIPFAKLSKIYNVSPSKLGFDFRNEIESSFFVSKNIFELTSQSCVKSSIVILSSKSFLYHSNTNACL